MSRDPSGTAGDVGLGRRVTSLVLRVCQGVVQILHITSEVICDGTDLLLPFVSFGCSNRRGTDYVKSSLRA